MPVESTDSTLFGPTTIVFGVITVFLYVFIIRPLLPTTNANTAQAPAANALQPPGATGNNNSNATNLTKNNRPRRLCTRLPAHVPDSSSKTTQYGGYNVLVDGLVAFSNTRAASSTPTDAVAVLRKERAQVLARLFSSCKSAEDTALRPPKMGSTVVVSVPIESVSCAKQKRILYLLATYYNILLVLVVAAEETAKSSDAQRQEQQQLEQEQQRDQAVTVLRMAAQIKGSAFSLSKEILPDHRILVSSTIAGRVALVRQLQRLELVLDFEEEVKGLLARFDHRVLVYSGQKKQEEGTSALGSILL